MTVTVRCLSGMRKDISKKYNDVMDALEAETRPCDARPGF